MGRLVPGWGAPLEQSHACALSLRPGADTAGSIASPLDRFPPSIVQPALALRATISLLRGVPCTLTRLGLVLRDKKSLGYSPRGCKQRERGVCRSRS